LEGLKFGLCAVAALLHDVLVLVGIFAMFGFVLNWQVDSLFITGLLTVIGFSVHDTIIIFDRLRENLHHRLRGESFADVADRSIEQTFARSINTSSTVVLTLLALLLLGGPTIRTFIVALLIGIISGTYSSIFNATPLLVLWKRLSGEKAAATAAAAGPAARPAPRPTPQRPTPQAPRPRPTAQPPTSNGDGSTAIPDEDHIVSVPGADRVKPKKKKRRM
jgi:preprotein translocase subunit SecF